MNKLKILTIAFFVLLILSFPFSSVSNQIFSVLLIIADFIMILGLYIFLSGAKTKRIGKIRIESAQYPFTYVLRAYTNPKNLWIVYDEGTKRFRTADWRNLPVRVILLILLGAGLLYTAYLIWFTIYQVFILIFFRLIVMFLFFVMGLYSLFLGLYRLFSLSNKKADKVLKFLNKSKILISLIQKGLLYVQITPNFLIREGFVDSVEFILVEKIELEKLEKILIDTARLIQKL